METRNKLARNTQAVSANNTGAQYMSRKAKAARKSANVSKLSATAQRSKSNAEKTAQPGIIASIMQQLTTAKQRKHPVTAQDILDTLCKQFPERKREGMLITVRAQLSRLPNERDFAINKVRDGRVVTYSAA